MSSKRLTVLSRGNQVSSVLQPTQTRGWDPECDRFRSKIKQSILTTEPQKNELVFSGCTIQHIESEFPD